MKYKHSAAPGWYVQIDGDNRLEFNKKNKPQRYAEMMAWVAEGNEIEPYETAEEIAERESEESKQALESQNQTIQTLLDEADKKAGAEYRNTEEEKAEWRIFGDKLLVILKSGIVQELPEKPY
jgi:hypothetical protein